jgi:hypothetical protein
MKGKALPAHRSVYLYFRHRIQPSPPPPSFEYTAWTCISFQKSIPGGTKKINPSWRCARGFIFFIKTTYMLYFLIMKGNELHVHEIHPRDEEIFRLLYEEKILVQGTSVQDVLRQFDELPLIINYGW